MNKAARTIGISLLALTVGVGASGCTSPASPIAPESASSSSSATSTPSPSRSKAQPRTEIAPPTPQGVANTLNDFFAAVDEESKLGLATVTKELKDENLSPEEVDSVLREGYPESLTYIDQRTLGAEKGKKLLGVLGALGIMSADISAVPEGIVMNGDIAVVPHDSLRISVDKVDHPAKSGSITLKYSSGRWVITDYKSAAETAK